MVTRARVIRSVAQPALPHSKFTSRRCSSRAAQNLLFSGKSLFTRCADCPTSSTSVPVGLIAGIELAPREDQLALALTRPSSRPSRKKVLIRFTGDVLALSPPLILEFDQIDQIVSTLRSVLAELR